MAAESIFKEFETNSNLHQDNSITVGPDSYCPKNGRPHTNLLEFGIDYCQACDTVLRVPASPVEPAEDRDSYDSNENYSRSESSRSRRIRSRSSSYVSSSNESVNHDLEKGDVQASSIEHILEFRDGYGNQIKRQRWKKGYFDWTSTDMAEADSDDRLVLQAIVRWGSNRKYIKRAHRSNLLSHPEYQFTYQGTALHIYSSLIVKALKVVALYPQSLTAPCTIDEPYSIIGHHLPALKEYASNIAMAKDVDKELGTEDKDAKPTTADLEHINVLLDWLKRTHYEEKLEKERQRNEREVCTFRMLWTILKPGGTVYMTSQGVLGAYVIDSVKIAALIDAKRKNRKIGILDTTQLGDLGYTIQLWNLQYDGRFVGRTMTSVIIPFFQGEQKISDLKTIPIEFFRESQPGTTRANLERLGKLWYKTLRGQQVYYKGRSMQEPEKQIEGRAYADPTGYSAQRRDREKFQVDEGKPIYIEQVDTSCPCDQCHGVRKHPAPDFPWKDYDVIDPKTVDDLETPNSPFGANHRYMVCDHKVWAVLLKTRMWELLNIAHCSEPVFREDAIEKLVMPAPRKNMIKALVTKFGNTKKQDTTKMSWRADFVEGKGEGTIFLLHGGPGVGKTFTAECIAEFTKRPLISLTCADIGTDEVKIEEKLEMWLRTAERWGAVLLIDEADIFMERRQVTDLKRNSLVSVFLRCLEYYRGILFLTTNRVGHFDDAFISRIHVVIKYESLNEHDRKQIWSQFFEKLENERRDFEISRSAKNYVLGNEADALYKQPWNGRTIRNVFQTAVTLAEYRAQNEQGNAEPNLKSIDFEQVGEMSRQFNNYLERISGLTEDQRAFNLGARVNTQEF